MAIINNKQKGVSLVELLVVMALIITAIISLFAVFSFAIRTQAEKKAVYQAGFLAKEAMEVVRSIRDNTDWSVDGLGVLVMGSQYHLEQQGAPAQWALLPNSQVIGDFTREIVFNNARRDGADNIIESGGVVDSDTKKATVTVSWTQRGDANQVSIVGFFTNWQ